MFTWGSMKTAPEELIFCSRQIRTQPGGRPLVHQAAYSVGITICKIQGDLTLPLGPEHRTKYLSVTAYISRYFNL